MQCTQCRAQRLSHTRARASTHAPAPALRGAAVELALDLTSPHWWLTVPFMSYLFTGLVLSLLLVGLLISGPTREGAGALLVRSS